MEEQSKVWRHRRRGVTVALVSAVALASGVGAAAGASRTAQRATVASASFDVELPVQHGPHGVQLQIAPECGGPAATLDASFSILRHTDSLNHLYSGPIRCELSRDLRHVGIHARWGAELALNLTLTQVGRSHVSHEKLTRHCVITDTTRTYLVTGAVTVAIHPGVLGTYRFAPKRVSEDSSIFPRCVFKSVDSGSSSSGGLGVISVGTSARSAATTATTTTTGTTTTGTTTTGTTTTGTTITGTSTGTTTTSTTTGTSTTVVPPSPSSQDSVTLEATGKGATRKSALLEVIAFSGEAGQSLVTVSRIEHDIAVPHVSDEVVLGLFGGVTFNYAANLQSATVDLNSSLSSGSFSYTSTGLCRRKHAVGTTGSLTGSASFKDPVAGTVTIDAADLGGHGALSYLAPGYSANCS